MTARARLEQLARLTAGYSLATLAGPIFTLVLTPLYTRVLHPNDYAVLDTATTLGILMLTFGMLGLNGAVSVYYYDGDEMYGRRVLTTAAVVSVIWSLLIALVVAAIARPLAAFSLGSERQAVLLYLSALNLPFAVLYGIIQVGLRLRLDVRRANILSLGYLVLTVGLNILFVLVLGWGTLGILSTITIATVILTAVGLGMTWRAGWGRPTWQLVRPLIRAGLPFVPAGLSFWALAYLDRLLLPLYAVGLTERGLYAIAGKLASMLTIILVPFQQAWGPLALSIQHEPEARHTYGKVLTYFTVLGLGCALALALFAREILLIFTAREYVAAAPFVALLVYAVAANSASVAVGVGAYIAKRTDIIGAATVLAAAVNLGLNVLLIPRLGVWGAVWATALGYAAAPIALYIASQRIYPMPFELAKVLRALGAQSVLLLVSMWIQTGDAWLDLALKLLLLPAYALLLVLLRVLDPREVRALLRILGRPRAALTTLIGR